jgi:hypothetical protein
MKHWLVTCALLLTALAPRAGGVDDDVGALSTEALLARAADYAHRFEHSMSTVVLEERYVQVIKNWTRPPKAPDQPNLTWADDLSKVQPNVIVKRRRQLKSDMLLVQLPDQRWTAFRDTFEVNGRLQPNRGDRLRSLFLQQTDDSRRQLRRINQASADWNLGDFYREVNLPTVGLFIFLARNQRRFAFQAGEVVTGAGAPCRVITFKETSTPTLVQSLRGRNVPLSGSACIDEAGVVSSTRLEFDSRHTTRGLLEVTYRPHERVDVLVPDRMWDWYLLTEFNETGQPTYVEGMATYSNLRQFSVTTAETVK